MKIWPFKRKLKIESDKDFKLIEIDTSKNYIALCSDKIDMDDVIAFGDMHGGIIGIVRKS